MYNLTRPLYSNLASFSTHFIILNIHHQNHDSQYYHDLDSIQFNPSTNWKRPLKLHIPLLRVSSPSYLNMVH